jgi:hypothetical protein
MLDKLKKCLGTALRLNQVSEVTMSRRFVIVRPKPCCGNINSIGNVYEEDVRPLLPVTICGICGKMHTENTVGYRLNGMPVVVEVCRIKWLPPESDIIEHDTIQEIEDKLKV